MYYYLIIALQIYCAYHVYTTKNKIYWYFVIFFLPAIGSIIYLITQVFSKNDIDKVQNEITDAINPTKKIKNLEHKVSFADTFQNRIDLADSYLDIKDYTKAIEHYTIALVKMHDNDLYGNSQLIKAYFEQNGYEDIIAVSEKMKQNPLFKKEEAYFLYGFALYKVGKIEKAEPIMRAADTRYSNYPQRLELSKFLIEIDKKEDAIELLKELKTEGETLTKESKRTHKKTFDLIEALYKDLMNTP
ncbi:hypothetical protein [Patiriisocius sp. Uisw_017]|uniref:hypothetical protein n=1 Tax=Patiriisocius sp. Uisw_017 TaxID=3230968 RepID=UPI0039E80B67